MEEFMERSIFQNNKPENFEKDINLHKEKFVNWELNNLAQKIRTERLSLKLKYGQL